MTALSLPNVLSLQRGFVLSDGLFSNLHRAANTDALVVGEPIMVVRQGLRGVMDKAGSDHIGQVQRSEVAKTHPTAVGLEVRFGLRTLPARRLLFACSEPTYREHLQTFTDQWFQQGVAEFDEVCLRYARNILMGRWLWRNRNLGSVTVQAQAGDAVFSGVGAYHVEFPATQDGYTDDERRLARVLSEGFTSNEPGEAVTVRGHVQFNFEGAVEVFPSENMVTGKPKGFARSLYKVDMLPRGELQRILRTADDDGEGAGAFEADQIVMGRAALRDQKIGNALRTIDTWFDGAASYGTIAVEPNGASLATFKAHRGAKTAGSPDAKSLLKTLNTLRPAATFNPDAAFLIAVMIRGGVFSESEA